MELQKNKPSSFNKKDIALILLALLMFIGSITALVSPKFYNYVWNKGKTKDGEVVGFISTKKNDVRIRDEDSFTWNASWQDQKVNAGDSVFVANNSSSIVKLNNGDEVQINENSMVTFKSLQSAKIPDFTFGSFSLKLTQDTTISINGQITQFKASDANVKIELNEGQRPKISLMSGQAQVAKLGEDYKDIKDSEKLELPYTYNNLYDDGLAEASNISGNELANKDYSYTLKVCDIYTCDSQKITKRNQLPQKVNLDVDLSWSSTGAKTTYIQIADNNNFTNSENIELPTFYKSYKVYDSYLNDNFYRFSVDNKNWSTTQAYRVNAQTLDIKAPEIYIPNKIIYKDSDQGQLNYIIQGRAQFNDYIIEIYHRSLNSEKLVHTLKTALLTNKIKILKPGKYYLRARGVNSESQLSSLGQASYFELRGKKPKPKPKPKPQAKQIFLTDNKKLPDKKVALRQPTAVETAISQVWEKIVGSRNSSITKSKISLEGSGFTMFSSDQSSNGTEAPVALLLGLRIQHWMGQLGFGGSFRSKTFNISDSASTVTPTQIEARIAHRWPLGFGFLGNHTSQVSIIGAFESYTNSSTNNDFASNYNLLKVGAGLDFPVFKNWDTGGELLFGQGLDGSNKFEVSGYVDYYLQNNLSLGGGYRVHLFEAGSTKSAPSTLPYREGFGEAYSTLRWHY